METVQSADRTTLAFDRSGSGPALVLVVGAFSDRSSTKSLAAALASTFTVYEYDRRGRGDSDEKGPYAVEREVEDLDAVIGAAGGAAFAFGHSSGAALVLEAAANGSAVTALAVYEPPYAAGATLELAAQLSALVAEGRRAEVAEKFLTLVGTPPQALADITAGPYWPRMQAFANTLPYEVTLCNDGSAPVDRLATIEAPTLALAGGASPAWAQDVARAIAATVPGARWRVLDGQGHGAADEVLVPVLTDFFADG